MPRGTAKQAPVKEPKKRAKGRVASGSTSAAVVKPAPRNFRRGQLKMLPEMPLDILFEIFSCLEPSDVLNLARTTKDLRNVLMSRSARSIWKSAFLNDPDLPGLPENLNEPQYANLAFSPHCHSCFVAGEHYILWAFQLRLCQKCMEGRFEPSNQVLKKVPGNVLTTPLLRYATIGYGGSFFSHEEAAELNAKLLKLKKADPKEFEEFCEARRKQVQEIQEHASQAQMAAPKREARMQRMREEARERRKNAICERLRELGYADEVEFINDTRPEMLSAHSLVKSENVLTDHDWINIRPQLEELMQSVTEKMQRRKRKLLLKNRQRLLLSILKEFVHERPIDEPNPRAVDVCVMPHIKAMLEDASMDAYTTKESFQELVDDLPRLFEEWRESKTLDLLALLPGHNTDRDLLARATTYFRCDGCREPIAYPRILAHSCLSELQHGHRNREDDVALLCTNLDSEPWNYGGKRVSYYAAAEASAKSVVRACGLNVDITTAQDMDDVRSWLTCLRCSHKVKGRAVFRWRKAILHDMYHVAAGERFAWRLLNDTDAEAAEALQEKTHTESYSGVPEYVCMRCRQHYSFMQMRGHIRIGHAIDDPEFEEDYVLHIDASMDQPPFPLMLPPSMPEVIELHDDTRTELRYSGDVIVIDD
ncbi:F-box domain-containing protein [Mycena sanguinolenta]|uniref:F-box domain-containing protein n=1 Tax=Mycena sanguinolenta TaxID=230812 RepID=A0A8H6YPD0_9AGAR|nr:F-box domain-containing protein [Mycena sanguinolenta]